MNPTITAAKADWDAIEHTPPTNEPLESWSGRAIRQMGQWSAKHSKDLITLAEAQASRIAELEEALNAIIDRGPERDFKWSGMSAKDIAIFALKGPSDD